MSNLIDYVLSEFHTDLMNLLVEALASDGLGVMPMRTADGREVEVIVAHDIDGERNQLNQYAPLAILITQEELATLEPIEAPTGDE